jgi:hypothetical protein
VPSWLRIINAVIGVVDVATQRLGNRSDSRLDRRDELTSPPIGGGGGLEKQLAGVVVAALKEAFDRDHRRLELEREQIEAERQRAERALRLELLRQAGEREIGRLRLLAGVALVSWLGTFFFATRLLAGGGAARALLAAGWLFLLAALGTAFAGQTRVGRSLDSAAEHTLATTPSAGIAGAIAPWLIVAGLAAIGVSVLMT